MLERDFCESRAETIKVRKQTKAGTSAWKCGVFILERERLKKLKRFDSLIKKLMENIIFLESILYTFIGLFCSSIFWLVSYKKR